ncbi:hypothetical protein QBC44DRAFT_245830, partial [Cladorrhinum sp. PSN332]
DSPIPGYGIEVLEWEAQPTPDSPFIHVNGTIQNLVAELTRLNPHLEADIDAAIRASEQETSANPELAARDLLAKRYDVDGYFCFGRWAAGRLDPLNEGIRYLRGVGGRPTRGPGPGNCSRVSCSYKTAIYWCNDNSGTKTLNSFGAIADGVQHLASRCRRFISNGQWSYTESSGQVFYKDKWNVVVRYDSNNC